MPAQGLFGQPLELGFVELLDQFLMLFLGIELAQPLAQLRRRHPVLRLVMELAAQLARRPAQMGFENLPDVHPRGHAQRIEHDVDRRAVFEPRHVFFGQDPREHALVAVPPGHLVADLEPPFDRDEHLDHLDHARRQFVARLEPVDLGARSGPESP